MLVTRLLAAIMYVAALGPGFQAAAQVQRPHIWLAPLQPYTSANGEQFGTKDYWDLFDEKRAAAAFNGVEVFKIYPGLLRSATDEQIASIGVALSQRGVALALESPILTDYGSCGPDDSRAIGLNLWMVTLAQRLKRLNVPLRFFAMVGPFVDGVVTGTPKACRRKIEAVVQDAARTVSAIQKLFPHVEIGEIEPLGAGPRYPDWTGFAGWLDTWQALSGHKLDFVHFDVEWGTDWRPDLRRAEHVLSTRGIPFGVIYDGTPDDLSDVSFAEAALRNGDAVEREMGHAPNDVIIQSWQKYPRHALPSTGAGSMTAIVHDYLRPPSTVSLAGDRVRLTDDAGRAIAGADLLVLAHRDPDMEAFQLAGEVPHDARSALVAIRVHTECACSDEAVAAEISDLRFTQPGISVPPQADESGPLQLRPANGEEAAPSLTIRVAAGGDPLVINGPAFAVQADQNYLLSYRWRAQLRTPTPGYVALIFRDAAGREIRRPSNPMRESLVVVETIRTDTNGSAPLPSAGVLTDADAVIVNYLGAPQHRPARLVLR